MNLLQQKASDPQNSVWVSASAGTGKTKILTDRVLRLLVDGNKFGKILCLTFTNAAANEMKERIHKALSFWSNCNQQELKDNLKNLLGKNSDFKEQKLAKNLYHKYLKSEENINIQTIHSFCQKLLKKFPMEVNIAPNFDVMDEIKSINILRQIKRELLKQDQLSDIIEYLTINFHDLIIDEILNEIIQHKVKFLEQNINFINIKSEAKKIISSITNQQNEKYLSIIKHPTIENIIGFNSDIETIKKFFLTDKGEKRKRIVAKKIAEPGSNLYNELQYLQDEIYLNDQKEKLFLVEQHSKILSILANHIIQTYETYKQKRGLLDYDDLIIYTNKLLKSSSAKEWVLYKLDGGIEHLLVDEAQDTSIKQWQIIEALIEEFHSGESSEKNNKRTIFVVGDEKQSIFSFQGADVKSFNHMNNLLKQKIILGGKNFKNIELETSYRSAKEILDIVYYVFTDITKNYANLFSTKIPNISAYRSNSPGSVELWPLCESDSKKDLFWPMIEDFKQESSKLQLAEQIALYIKDILKSNQILPSTSKPIQASDFMILFRKRDDFTQEVINSLQQHNIEVSGLDRITLRDNPAIKDILSIGYFVLNQDDNLNLAALLKSPIFALEEKLIYKINQAREKFSIWDYLKNNDDNNLLKDTYIKLKNFIELYSIANISNFFQYVIDILGYREIINSAFNNDNNDIIDEFLYLCKNYATNNNTSLQDFIFWINENDSSIKRDNLNSNHVKIMTVHASKGLQSPIVIMCDTTGLPTDTDHFLWDKKGKNWSTKSSSQIPKTYKDLKQEKKNNLFAEYLRLLYVGMTRAEDKLVICGYKNERDISDNCWYSIIKNSMEQHAIEVEHNDQLKILIYKNEKENYEQKINPINFKQDNKRFFTPQKMEHQNLMSQSIRQIGYFADPFMKYNPLKYGLVFHKILEDAVLKNDLNLMNNHPLIYSLEDELQNRIKRSIDNIINNDQFNQLIKFEKKTEMAIGSSNERGLINIERIDLIIFKENEIIVIDYKSDEDIPAAYYLIPKNYIIQMQHYKESISNIFPNKKVITMILWLTNGELIEIK